MAAQVIGLKNSVAPSTDTNSVAFKRNVQAGVVLGSLAKFPSGGWIDKIGVMCKRSNPLGQTPQIVLAVWEKLSNGQPGQLLARTNPLALPSSYTNLEGAIVWTRDGLSQRSGGLATALRVNANQEVIFGFLALEKPGILDLFNVVTIASYGNAATPTAQWYVKPNGTTQAALPLNPFGTPAASGDLAATFSSNRPAIYALFTDSTKPTITIVSPAAGASIGDTTPVLVADFADVDATPFGDVFAGYELIVRPVGSTTPVWSGATALFLTDLSEKINKRFNREYAGSPLVVDTPYEWAARMQDAAGEWSDLSAFRTFTVGSFGTVDTSSSALPVGKVDGDSGAIAYQARYKHTDALNATHVRVRILSNGATYREGPWVAKAITGVPDDPGTLFTVTAAEAGINALPYGQAFQWQIRARSTDLKESQYSNPVDFRTNALPSTPIPVAPLNDSIWATPPLVVSASRDTDDDDVALVDVVWDVEITRLSNGNVVTVLADVYDSASGRPSKQLTSAEVPALGLYSWRMRGRDTSAGSFGVSAWSDPRVFNYSIGPAIVISQPTQNQVVGTTQPRIAWTSNVPQTAFQVLIYPVTNGVAGTTPKVNTGKITSPTMFYDVDPNKLSNNADYEVSVTSWDDTNTPGSSVPRRFRVQFFGAASLSGVTAATIMRLRDVEPSAVALTWSPTSYPANAFRNYIVTRTQAGEITTLAIITNPAQLSFIDDHAPPGVALEYNVYQTAIVNNATVTSAPAMAAVELTMFIPTLVSAKNPNLYRLPLMWFNDGFDGNYRAVRTSYVTWGSKGKPTIVRGVGGQKLRTVSFTVRTDDFGTLKDKMAALDALVESGDYVCIRTESERLFMDIADYAWKKNGRTRRVTLKLEEVNYRDGIAA